ncbi:MAG: patatin-like phospholipase family protein [Sandaracinaceae bacterium]
MTRVSLVLGSGGPVGHAFHAGALLAIHEELGIDAREASLIIGTSAGAQVAALLRAKMSVRDVYMRSFGGRLSTEGEEIARHYVRPSHEPPPGPSDPWRPASMAYVRCVVQRPWRANAGHLVSALMRPGRVSLEPQAHGLRRLFDGGWSERPLWIVAVDLDSGDRVILGRPGGPTVDVGTAVAASGAVPGMCAPVPVDRLRLVDGGVISASHSDLLVHADHEVAIVINPLSLFPPLRLTLRRELRELRRRGDRVLLVEPTARTRRVMGLNPMATDRAREVARAARWQVRAMLREPGLRERLDAWIR